MTRLPIIDKLEEELKKVTRELRVDVPLELKKAAAHGDLRENSEYEAAKHRQSYLQARAGHLSQRIQALSSLKLEDIPRDAVAFGAKVVLEDMDTGDKVSYELVTPEEVDPRKGRISVSSPIGRALLHKKVGEDVQVTLPAGAKEYAVVGLRTLHDIVLDEDGAE
jgi:transcription elongation factor GreA